MQKAVIDIIGHFISGELLQGTNLLKIGLCHVGKKDSFWFARTYEGREVHSWPLQGVIGLQP